MKVTKTIDDCFYFIQNGANIKQSKIDGGYPITRIETISNDRFNRDKMGYAGITDLTNYSNYILENDDLLMSHINSPQYLGRTILYKKKKGETIIHGMNLLRLKANTELIKPSYARYVFYSNSFRQQIIKITKKSVNQASFSVNDLKKIKLELPEIKEQQNIVNKLDKISNIIDLKTKKLRLLDELVKARFVEMFGDPILNDKDWKISTFDDLTYIITDGEHSTPKRTNQGIYLLSARNILNHRLHLEDVDFIDKNEFERIAKRVFPQEGDVLLSCSGTVGRCCIVPKNFKFQMVRSVALLRFKEEINPLFAEYMITSDYLQRQIDKAKTSSSQANLFQGKIKTLKGIVPPIELQSQFSDFVQQVDKSKFMNVRMICKFKKNVR